MYDLVTSWDWGGSGEDIYHDIETRRNGITYRGNLARLIEQLINEDKLDKAEEIADLAMEKMPVDTFGFYSLLEPYISTYFEVGNRDKARNLFKEVARKYQENLMYLSSQPLKTQERLIEDIYTDIQRYRALVDVLVVYDNEDFVLEETKKFNSYLQLFDPLMGPSEEEPMPSDDIDINALLNDSSSAIAPEED
jgi:tetratricopeptide (TPR) repeat protein